MITVISATNRPGSRTEQIADLYVSEIQRHSTELVRLLKLTDLPLEVASVDLYSADYRSERLDTIQHRYMIPASKLFILLPEYNGGIPGIFKLFVDAMSLHNLSDTFHGKKACLTGVASGRAGNLRGLDYLTNVLHYLKVDVYADKVPISSIESLFEPSGKIGADSRAVIESQIRGFLTWAEE